MFLASAAHLYYSIYKTLTNGHVVSGGWYIPVQVFLLQKCTEMLLVHLGPVMQIRLQIFRTSRLPSQHSRIAFLPHGTKRLLV